MLIRFIFTAIRSLIVLGIFSSTCTAANAYLLTKIDDPVAKQVIGNPLGDKLLFQASTSENLTTYCRVATYGDELASTTHGFIFLIFENNGESPIEINRPSISMSDDSSHQFTPDSYEQYYVNAKSVRDDLISKISDGKEVFLPIPMPPPQREKSSSYYYSGTTTSSNGQQYQTTGYIRPIRDRSSSDYAAGAVVGTALVNIITAISHSISASFARIELKKIDAELDLMSKYWIRDHYIIPPHSSITAVSTFTYPPILPANVYIKAADKNILFRLVDSYKDASRNLSKESSLK